MAEKKLKMSQLRLIAIDYCFKDTVYPLDKNLSYEMYAVFQCSFFCSF